jgi:hypothetical protein
MVVNLIFTGKMMRIRPLDKYKVFLGNKRILLISSVIHLTLCQLLSLEMVFRTLTD